MHEEGERGGPREASVWKRSKKRAKSSGISSHQVAVRLAGYKQG